MNRRIFLLTSFAPLILIITRSSCTANDNIKPRPSEIISLIKEINIDAASELSLREKKDGGYLFMNYYLNPNHQFLGGNTRLYFSKLNKNLEVVWTSWLNDKYTREINFYDWLPTELIATRDGALTLLFYNSASTGYLLVKTISFK
jgi:hypothetical protein